MKIVYANRELNRSYRPRCTFVARTILRACVEFIRLKFRLWMCAMMETVASRPRMRYQSVSHPASQSASRNVLFPRLLRDFRR